MSHTLRQYGYLDQAIFLPLRSELDSLNTTGAFEVNFRSWREYVFGPDRTKYNLEIPTLNLGSGTNV